MRRRCALAFAIGTLALVGTIGAAPVELDKRTRVRLQVSPLTGIRDAGSAPLEIDVDPERGGSVTFDLRWPDDRPDPRDLRLTIRAAPPRFDTRPEGRIAVTAVVEGLGDAPRETVREFAVDDGGTRLFEVLREDDVPLTVAIRMETREEPFVRPAVAAVGSGVVLNLEIHRIEGERSVRLETTRLQTFVGQSVGYSFDLGGTPDSPSLHLRFEPTRIVGEIVEIVVEANGRLPIDGAPRLVGRRETWVGSRGVGSSLTIAEGTPPTGYRFVVTPEY